MEEKEKEGIDLAFEVAIVASERVETPTGIAAQVGFTIAKGVFDMFTHAPEPEPMSKVVRKEIESALLGKEVKEGSSDFTDVYDWFSIKMDVFHRNWGANISSEKYSSDPTFIKFLDSLEDKLATKSPLRRFIGLLEKEGPINPKVNYNPTQEKAFDVWMIGVGTHLMLRKFHLLVQKGEVAIESSLSLLLTSLNHYIEDGWKNSMAREYLNIFPYLEMRMNHITLVLDRADFEVNQDHDAFWYDPYEFWGVNKPGNKGGLFEATGFVNQHTHFSDAWLVHGAYVERRKYEWERFYRIAKTLNKWSLMYSQFAHMYHNLVGSNGKENFPVDKHPIYEHPVAYKKMNFSADGCGLRWIAQTDSAKLLDMMKLADEYGSYGLAYDAKSKVGWVTDQEFPKDCRSPLKDGLPEIYLPY